jgi:hypothetical protein
MDHLSQPRRVSEYCGFVTTMTTIHMGIYTQINTPPTLHLQNQKITMYMHSILGIYISNYL